MICFRLINSHHSQFPAVNHHHIVALRYSADFNSVIFVTFARAVSTLGLCSYLYSGVVDFCLAFKHTALAGQCNICHCYLHFSAAYPMVTCSRRIFLFFRFVVNTTTKYTPCQKMSSLRNITSVQLSWTKIYVGGTGCTPMLNDAYHQIF